MNLIPSTSRLIRIPAILLLAVYLLVTGTLDLHHNHGSVDCDGAGTECGLPHVPVERVSITEHDHDDPCPVLTYTLSHAPGPPPVANSVQVPFSSFVLTDREEPLISSVALPSPRAPPFS